MMNEEFLTLTIGKQKNIALIAHDSKKPELISWCEEHKDILKNHFLCGTGTTARMITDKTGLPVKGYNSGPLGGDQQIGARIVEGRIDFVIFFSDPLTAQPHDPDVKALLRIAQVYDIPIANNRATADFLITSTLMDQEYDHPIVNFKRERRFLIIRKFTRGGFAGRIIYCLVLRAFLSSFTRTRSSLKNRVSMSLHCCSRIPLVTFT